MLFNMRALASTTISALIISVVSGRPAGAHEHPHAWLPRTRDSKVAVVTCMDPRIKMDLVYRTLGLKRNNAFIIRNAGGRAKAALSSVLITQEYFGSNEVHVIHHTDCGMANKTEKEIQDRFYAEGGYSDPNRIHFLPIAGLNFTHSACEDADLIKLNPLNRATKVTGWVYNIGEFNDTVTQVYPNPNWISPIKENLPPPTEFNTFTPYKGGAAPPGGDVPTTPYKGDPTTPGKYDPITPYKGDALPPVGVDPVSPYKGGNGDPTLPDGATPTSPQPSTSGTPRPSTP